MGQTQDVAWNYVDIISNLNGLETKRWKCNFYKAEHIVVATRVKAHLGGVRGQNIVACLNVLPEVCVLYAPILAHLPLSRNFGTLIASVGGSQGLHGHDGSMESQPLP
jgi:hypothetical protein